jgi:hypothetical protein
MATRDQTMLSNDLGEAIDAFAAALRSDGQDAATVDTFERGCRLFNSWLEANGGVRTMDRVSAGHVEDWEAELRQTMPHNTFHDNHRGVQQFLTWYGRQRDPDWRTRSAWRRAPVESPR